MAESECGRGELVHDGRVALLVVAIVEPVRLEAELVQVDGVPSENSRQELVPRDMLKMCRVISNEVFLVIFDVSYQ